MSLALTDAGLRIYEHVFLLSDEDECERKDNPPCAADQICENLKGGYSCKCKLGFEMAAGECKGQC